MEDKSAAQVQQASSLIMKKTEALRRENSNTKREEQKADRECNGESGDLRTIIRIGDDFKVTWTERAAPRFCFSHYHEKLLPPILQLPPTPFTPIHPSQGKKAPCARFSKQGRGTLITSMYPHLFSTRDEEPPALCDEGTLYTLAARS